MAYLSQLAFEIRAGDGAPDDVFEQLLGIYLPAFADEEDLDAPTREELAYLLGGALIAHEEKVMRRFDPHYQTAAETTAALFALEELVSTVDLPGSSFCGGFIRIGEENEVEKSFWSSKGNDCDAVVDSLQWDQVLLPEWTNFGVHLTGWAIRNDLDGLVSDQDVQRICNAAMPSVRALVRQQAMELGYRVRGAVIV